MYMEEENKEQSAPDTEGSSGERKVATQTLEEKILDILSRERFKINQIAEVLAEDEKVVKKSVDALVKKGEVKKHRNRPLQFSRIMKLPGME